MLIGIQRIKDVGLESIG